MARGDLSISDGVRIPEDEILESVSRSRGPGGQHVNKTETRVTLHWKRRDPRARERQRARLLARLGARLTRDGELVVHATACSRSQAQTASRPASAWSSWCAPRSSSATRAVRRGRPARRASASWTPSGAAARASESAPESSRLARVRRYSASMAGGAAWAGAK